MIPYRHAALSYNGAARPDWVVVTADSGIAIELAHPAITTPEEALKVRLSGVSGSVTERPDMMNTEWFVIDLRSPRSRRGLAGLTRFTLERNEGYRIERSHG